MAVAQLLTAQAQNQEQLRLETIYKAWQTYYGIMRDTLKPIPGSDINDNVKVNYSKLVVNAGVNYLFGKDFEFTVGEEDNPNDAATETLAGFWKQNKIITSLLKIGINGGVSGHTFLKLVLNVPGKKYPRLVVLDSQNVHAYYSPEDYEDVLGWKIQWEGLDAFTGKPVAYREMITRADNGQSWTMQMQKAEPAVNTFAMNSAFGSILSSFFRLADWSDWKNIGDAIIHPYEWSPIFHCQNLPAPNVFYGMSDLEPDVIDNNLDMNDILSNSKRILRFHAHPKTWASGLNADQIDISVDGVICLPDVQSKLSNVEMQSDLGSSIEIYKLVKEAFHNLTQVPEIATGKIEGLGQLSGVALRIMFEPLMQKTRVKRELYGEMLTELCQRVLEVQGLPEQDIDINWGELLPADAKEEAETYLLQEQLGVSKDTILGNMGYDYEQEAAKKKTEAEADMQLQAKAVQMMDRGQMPAQKQDYSGGNE